MTSFHLETYGCSHNFADSEQMAGLLKQAKFTPVDHLDSADILIFNTCTVKGPSESQFFTRLLEIKNQFPYKIIIIAGCIPQSDPEKLKKYALLGTRQIHHVVEVVEEALHHNIVQMLDTGEMPPLNLPKIRKNPIVEIIPISRGCLSACTFCKTKSARGNLQSYPVAEIRAIAEKAVQEGVKEIWLTSQDTGCYGFDLGTNAAKLIQELVSIPGNFKIRLGMGNPVHILKFKDELLPLFNHARMFKFLHLPLQTGSDDVLQQMRRGNSAEEWVSLVQEARLAVPGITIATDIIVGFPTETEQDYWDTLNVVRKTTPEVINISKFWPRSKTPAAKLKPLPGEVVTHRAKVLMDMFQNISKMNNEKWIGWEGKIVIDEQGKGNCIENGQEGTGRGEKKGNEKSAEEKVAGGKSVGEDDKVKDRNGVKEKDGAENGKKQWIGRNDSYKPVLVEGDFKLGDEVRVRVVKAGTFDVRGEVVR